ncbi:virulence factor TspB C-terminal domain-related protein [Halomonas beimenensis]|uniref:virulence factor TspB C-terminal domain-related protein n=1 Tax=Halomonas beimenensis TaxID=475662 RepID=UPI000BEF1AB0
MRASYRLAANDPRIYKQLSTSIPKASLRRAALSALARGVMHPGLQLAIVAAGFALSQNNEILAPDPEVADLEQIFETYADNIAQYGADGANGNIRFSGGYTMCTGVHPSIFNHIACYKEADAIYNKNLPFQGIVENSGSIYARYGTSNVLMGFTSAAVDTDPYYDPDGAMVPATEEDLETLDEHLPATIVDDIWTEGEPVPEWENEISIIGEPATSVVPTKQQAIAPAVARQVGQWAANTEAQLKGEPAPNPDAETGGNTAPDEMLDQWQEKPPASAYPTLPTPEWNVNVIDDLPDYDAGLGVGMCPEPNVIEIPLYGTISLDWQPACELAGNIRGAVIGLCFISALFIVLGQSRPSTA